ncbi:MAG: enoyl-CoA hydratase/isomerase family protein [Burkholderiaceae bacterium]
MSVTFDRHAGLAVIRFEVPEKGNALSPSLVAAADEALQSAGADTAVHTIAFCGAGRHLCTGFDLSDLDALDDGALLWRFVAIEQWLQRIWSMPKRTAAIGQGSTFGAGADLFAACDERWLRDGARFRFPGAGFGLVLGTRRLAERVGVDRARRWVAFGHTVQADEALAAGLANDRVAADDETWRARLAQAPAVEGETMTALYRATRADLADADLAALVRSAARPGLKSRIEAYRSALAAARKS